MITPTRRIGVDLPIVDGIIIQNALITTHSPSSITILATLAAWSTDNAVTSVKSIDYINVARGTAATAGATAADVRGCAATTATTATATAGCTIVVEAII